MAAACAAVLGCGGGDERQDADEPAGEYRVDVKRASFPSEQRLASRATMTIEVFNPADVRVPNVAVTIETEPQPGGEAPLAFGQRVADTTLADPGRPVWIVDRAPRGGDTAYTNTWALGELGPGETKRFVWRVTAVQPGSYAVGYRVAAGLDGKARLADGSSRTKGTFRVTIDDSPVDARVGDDGQVIRE
jgi:hypothetical protein